MMYQLGFEPKALSLQAKCSDQAELLARLVGKTEFESALSCLEQDMIPDYITFPWSLLPQIAWVPPGYRPGMLLLTPNRHDYNFPIA